MESPNLEFEYGDTDTLTAELSGKTAPLMNTAPVAFVPLVWVHSWDRYV